MENDKFSRPDDFATALIAETSIISVLLVILLLLLSGCATPVKIAEVKRQPPAADMVRPIPLPIQTDPTLGGIFQGYVNAAQQYRGCADHLMELQDWVSSLVQ